MKQIFLENCAAKIPRHFLSLITGMDENNAPFFAYVVSERDKCHHKNTSKYTAITLQDYGEVIVKGAGFDPPARLHNEALAYYGRKYALLQEA